MKKRKLDRRIVRTRKLLSNALIQLILEVGFDNITIRQLTDTADIGYATFYRHFDSKDELLELALVSTLKEYDRTLSPDMTHKEESLAFFQHIQEHRPVYQAGLLIPRDHPAMRAVHEHLAKVVAHRYQSRCEGGVPFEIAINHLVVSAAEFIRWFLENENTYSLEQVAEAYDAIIVQATEAAAFEPRTT